DVDRIAERTSVHGDAFFLTIFFERRFLSSQYDILNVPVRQLFQQIGDLLFPASPCSFAAEMQYLHVRRCRLNVVNAPVLSKVIKCETTPLVSFYTKTVN